MASQKIPGDRLVMAMISVVRTLIHELSRQGVLDQAEFVTLLQSTAIAHRQAGDPNNLAQLAQSEFELASRFVAAPESNQGLGWLGRADLGV
jgi:hypothetical protein